VVGVQIRLQHRRGSGIQRAKRSEQLRIAEDLQELFTTAGVLLVDAQGHGIVSAKIASTVHDTFHAFMLSELDQSGKTTPTFFEEINLRLAQSVSARNALGRDSDDNPREIATMLYGEICPSGHFRFVNFGHPPPLICSAEYKRFVEVDKDNMVQFLALGLEIPEDHPDRNRYFSMKLRKRQVNSSDVAEITLMSPGDILFLYTDGVYDGSDEEDRLQIERVIQKPFTANAELNEWRQPSWTGNFENARFRTRSSKNPALIQSPLATDARL
jgi:hypothetical protein